MIAQQTTTNRDLDWRQALPVLSGGMVRLREVELRDAASLLSMIADPEVERFISPPPQSVEAFEQFITWAHTERSRGRYLCYGVVPHGMERAIGLFYVRRLDPTFVTAEWGFALGSAFWGTGIFVESAELLLSFVFDVIALNRLEARVVVANGRANAALRKIGAVHEAVLRKAFLYHGHYLEQALYSIVQSDRLERRVAEARRRYVH